MNTIYVSDWGTDAYTVDGVADDVQINQALAYAAANATDENPITVYLRGPFTYELASWLLIGSNTILTGDQTAKLRLKDNAGWPNIYTTTDPGTEPFIKQAVTPIKNVEVHGFEIDGNDVNQPGYVGGKLNYIVMYFLYGTNISMHNMYCHDSLSDCMRMDRGNGLYFYDNVTERMGHEASYFIRSSNFLVFNNTTKIRRNSAHRVWNTGHGMIFNNYMEPYALTSISGNPGIQIEHSDVNYDMSGVEVFDNTIVDPWGEGIWIIEYGTGYQQADKGLYIHDNIIRRAGRITTINYNAGIAISGWNGTIFENNQIEDCYNAGFLVYAAPTSGTSNLYLINNTIYGTVETLNSSKQAWTGRGIVNPYPDNTKIHISNNTLFNNENGDYYNELSMVPSTRVSMFSPDPTFTIQDPEEAGGVKAGSWGIVLPAESGKYKYIFYPMKSPKVGEKALIYPAHSGQYYLLRLAQGAKAGERIIAVHDKKGNYWGVSSS